MKSRGLKSAALAFGNTYIYRLEVEGVLGRDKICANPN